jgi:hypothetical protein
MRFWKWVFLAALLAARVQASSLSFTLDAPYAVGQPGASPVEVFFSGSLIDNDTANTCDGDFVDCLYLNAVSFSFDQSTATSHLSPDFDSFVVSGVPGSLSDDGPDPSANGVLASSRFTLVVAPEPADFGLALTGFAAVLLLKRRVSA